MEDCAIRIEFQARGSPHAHTLIWVKDAPKFGVATDEDFSKFLDKYISCAIPQEEGELKDKVLLLQHRHSNYCKRGMKCRFRFPHPPSTHTLVTKPINGDNEIGEGNEASKVLGEVRKLLLLGIQSPFTAV